MLVVQNINLIEHLWTVPFRCISACSDRFADCKDRKSFCKLPAWEPFLKANCKQSCGYCTGNNKHYVTLFVLLCLSKFISSPTRSMKDISNEEIEVYSSPFRGNEIQKSRITLSCTAFDYLQIKKCFPFSRFCFSNFRCFQNLHSLLQLVVWLSLLFLHFLKFDLT